MLPVNQLMPPPIVWKQQEVVVGQPDARRIRLHPILHHARHSTVVYKNRVPPEIEKNALENHLIVE